jgi:hypothetical protein
MTNIDVAKLATIPFLEHAELQGRFLCSLFFYDGDWHSWIEAGEGIARVHAWPAEAMYFGTSPEHDTDIGFHFLNLIAQKLSFPPLGRQLFAIQDDIFNLSASLAKVPLLHENEKKGVAKIIPAHGFRRRKTAYR